MSEEQERIIKRWLSQTCIGYQKERGHIIASVIKGQVELRTGDICDAWQVYPLNGFMTMPVYREPRIDGAVEA